MIIPAYDMNRKILNAGILEMFIKNEVLFLLHIACSTEYYLLTLVD